MRDATRGGYLYKQSKGGEQSKQTFRIGNLGRQIRPSISVFKDQSSVGGLSSKSRRYFVFKDIFLSYFDNPTVSTILLLFLPDPLHCAMKNTLYLFKYNAYVWLMRFLWLTGPVPEGRNST